MKDKRNRQCAVGRSSSEQHFRKSATILLYVKFLEPYTYCNQVLQQAGGRQVAGRQLDEMQVNFEIFKTNCTPKHPTFHFV